MRFSFQPVGPRRGDWLLQAHNYNDDYYDTVVGRSSLMEVKQDLQERTTRWRQIESLCGFPIATNPGLNYLETLLRSGLNSSRYVNLNSSCK